MTEQTIEQLRAELAQARAELTSAYTARDALAQERDDLQVSRGRWVRLAGKRSESVVQAQLRNELAHARDELAHAKIKVNQLRAKLTQANEVLTSETRAATMWEGIAQERAHELAEARKVALSYLRMATKRKKELAQARAELKDLQGANRALGQQVADVTENRDYWYKTALAAEAKQDQIRKGAEGLRRQLAEAAESEAAIVEAAEALLGQLLPIVSFNKDAWMACGKEFRQLRETLEHRGKAAAKLLERLATLDAAEVALQAERKLRREAERELGMTEHTLEIYVKRVKWMKAKLDNGHKTLEAASIPFADGHGAILSIAGRIVRLNQRAERAEALAALVTPELANLLVLLACATHASQCTGTIEDAEAARELAAQIREALDDT